MIRHRNILWNSILHYVFYQYLELCTTQQQGNLTLANYVTDMECLISFVLLFRYAGYFFSDTRDVNVLVLSIAVTHLLHTHCFTAIERVKE